MRANIWYQRTHTGNFCDLSSDSNPDGKVLLAFISVVPDMAGGPVHAEVVPIKPVVWLVEPIIVIFLLILRLEPSGRKVLVVVVVLVTVSEMGFFELIFLPLDSNTNF